MSNTPPAAEGPRGQRQIYICSRAGAGWGPLLLPLLLLAPISCCCAQMLALRYGSIMVAKKGVDRRGVTSAVGKGEFFKIVDTSARLGLLS